MTFLQIFIGSDTMTKCFDDESFVKLHINKTYTEADKNILK